MTKRYLVTAMEYVYYAIEVQADSEEQAAEIATNTDPVDWETYDTDQWDIETIREIKDEIV